MGEVVELNGPTLLDIPAENVLQGAMDDGLQSVLIIGWDKDGKLFRACSTGDVAQQLLLIELHKQALMMQAFNAD